MNCENRNISIEWSLDVSFDVSPFRQPQFIEEEVWQMKRDMDLVRKLLLWLESLDDSGSPTFDESAYFQGYSEGTLSEHRYLIWKAGLARGCDGTTNIGYDAMLDGLTWEGHDFIEAARNETFWRKALGSIKTAGAALTIESLKAVLKRLTSEALQVDLP